MSYTFNVLPLLGEKKAHKNSCYLEKTACVFSMFWRLLRAA